MLATPNTPQAAFSQAKAQTNRTSGSRLSGAQGGGRKFTTSLESVLAGLSQKGRSAEAASGKFANAASRETVRSGKTPGPPEGKVSGESAVGKASQQTQEKESELNMDSLAQWLQYLQDPEVMEQMKGLLDEETYAQLESALGEVPWDSAFAHLSQDELLAKLEAWMQSSPEAKAEWKRLLMSLEKAARSALGESLNPEYAKEETAPDGKILTSQKAGTDKEGDGNYGDRQNTPANPSQQMTQALSEISPDSQRPTSVTLEAVSKTGEAPPSSQTFASHDTVKESVMSQVKAGIFSVMKDGIKRVEIQLVPEHLGKVHVALEVLPDSISGKITVENESVQKILEVNLPQLKEALQSQQVKVENLQVDVDASKQYRFLDRRGRGSEYATAGRSKGPDGGNPVEEMTRTYGMDTGRRWGYNTLELLA